MSFTVVTGILKNGSNFVKESKVLESWSSTVTDRS